MTETLNILIRAKLRDCGIGPEIVAGCGIEVAYNATSIFSFLTNRQFLKAQIRVRRKPFSAR